MTRNCWGLDGVAPEEWVEINPADAAILGVAHGDYVRVTTRRGSVVVRAEVTDRVPKGVTFITFHYTEAAGNLLTNSALDPVSKTPEYKVCAVRVEKVSA